MELSQCLYAWLDELENGRRVAPATYDAYKRDLEHAIAWMERQGIGAIGAVTRHHLAKYLQACRDDGARSATVSRRLASLRSFYRFLTRVGYTERDPSMHVELPRRELAKPVALTLDQVEQLMNAPATDSPAGLRDKAMLELLYGSGIRVSELLAMKASDPQPGLGYVRVCSPAKKSASCRSAKSPRAGSAFICAKAGRRCSSSGSEARRPAWGRRSRRSCS